MGLLDGGSPLTWEDTKKHSDHVKSVGVQQFLAIYERLRDRENDHLKWGDEIEFTVVHFDHDKKTAQVQLTKPELLEKLQEAENADPGNSPTAWRPEYGSFMLEATPGGPFGGATTDFNLIEPNMKLRRKELNELLDGSNRCMNITCFPRLGCPDFTNPPHQPKPTSSASHSAFFPDEAINPHPRFSTLTRNIRQRRGSKVAIHMPIFKDVNTPSPFVEDLSMHDEETQRTAKPDHIYMDAMGFGMGMSCLQVTFQACSITEGRLLYDQLAIVCPIVLALSASTPIYRGYMSDRDCRWSIIEQSVDDRTLEERGLEPLAREPHRIPRSRYGPVSCYLASDTYNEDVVLNREVYDTLRASGIDHLLATHVAHLFIRDPLTLFGEQIEQDVKTESNHFENIQSTNWQSMRFKPPPPHSSIGWRVEFRPTDLQLTPFQNSAMVIFVVILTRTILSLNLNFYVPIAKMHENLRRAQERNGVLDQKFYFRKNVHTDGATAAEAADKATPSEDDYEEMSIDTIINGQEGVFPGLIPLMDDYLRGVDMDVKTRCTVSRSFDLIKKRASGELKTIAMWMREFVAAHPDYKQDSVISERINYDLLMACDRISSGEEHCPDLEGSL